MLDVWASNPGRPCDKQLRYRLDYNAAGKCINLLLCKLSKISKAFFSKLTNHSALTHWELNMLREFYFYTNSRPEMNFPCHAFSLWVKYLVIHHQFQMLVIELRVNQLTLKSGVLNVWNQPSENKTLRV